MPELSCKTSKGHVENRASSANPSVTKDCRRPSRNERPKVRNHPSWTTTHEISLLAPAFTICSRFASKMLRFAEALGSNIASMDSFTSLVTVTDSIALYGGVISIVVSVDAVVHLCCPFRSSLRFSLSSYPSLVYYFYPSKFYEKVEIVGRHASYLIGFLASLVQEEKARPFCFASQERGFQSYILF